MLIGYLFIFFARVIDVTLGTMRTLMVVQGRKLEAATVGFFEVIIYITALGKVVDSLDNPLNLLAYGLGFACGNYVGIMVENKIALGKLGAQIVLKSSGNKELIEILRENKFGVTIIDGYGIDGPREILNVALNRKDLEKLKDKVYGYDKSAFITVSSINPISGGFFHSMKRK